MEIEVFVRNVRIYCERKGVKPTVACAESGAGRNLWNNVSQRGSIPSVDRVQLLAQYLGVTVSELIGEKTPPNPQTSADLTAEEWKLLDAYRAADERARQVVDLTLEPYRRERQRTKAIG